MKLTHTELQALDAIITAGTATTGERSEGWWSREILMYAKDCTLTPRQFSAACGSLAKKGATSSYEHERGQWHISPTAAGLAAYDEALDIEKLRMVDQAMLANAR